MSSKRGALYEQFFSAYKLRFPEKTAENCQKEANAIWADLKREADFEQQIGSLIKKYKQASTERKGKTLLSFFNQKPTPNSSTKNNEDNLAEDTLNKESAELPSTSEASVVPSTSTGSGYKKRTHIKPAQEMVENKINFLLKRIQTLSAARESLHSEDVEVELKKAKLDLEKTKKELKRKQQLATAQKKLRDANKVKLSALAKDIPVAATYLNQRTTVGRPRIEEDQPELHNVIIKIAMFGCGADERRRTEVIRTVKTLDDLNQELSNAGFELSRTATYMRLLPKNARTVEGKKHISTVPVKLCRAQNSAHMNHTDAQFATTSIRYLETLASILGPTQVFFLSQDDKARVPIGLTAANIQSPLLMHMEYCIRLPDHDWVVAPRHKLIPSVYAGINISSNEMGHENAVSYSGPTFIAIRSGKHSSSTASSHAVDFANLLNLEEFEKIAKTEEGLVKPVVIITSDGGPDENPRFPKVISNAIKHFRSYNLDALFIATNAPGRSAFNRVERRMAPLSRELAGIILPHDAFGSHLNNQGKTIDPKLEIENFEHAGKVLAQVWEGLVIDGYPVVAKFVRHDEGERNDAGNNDPYWYQRHVRESQYMVQIVKCTSRDCCADFRSGVLRVLPQRFLPPPIKVCQTLTDVVVPENSSEGKFADLLLRKTLHFEEYDEVAYDLFCPSLKDVIEKRTCNECGLYFASAKAVKEHRKVHAGKKCGTTKAMLDAEPSVLDNATEIEEQSIPVIEDMNEWLKTPFEN